MPDWMSDPKKYKQTSQKTDGFFVIQGASCPAASLTTLYRTRECVRVLCVMYQPAGHVRVRVSVCVVCYVPDAWTRKSEASCHFCSCSKSEMPGCESSRTHPGGGSEAGSQRGSEQRRRRAALVAGKAPHGECPLALRLEPPAPGPVLGLSQPLPFRASGGIPSGASAFPERRAGVHGCVFPRTELARVAVPRAVPTDRRQPQRPVSGGCGITCQCPSGMRGGGGGGHRARGGQPSRVAQPS